MQGARPVLRYGMLVQGCAVAFVGGEAIGGEGAVGGGHQTIAPDFGDQRSRRNRERTRIAFDHGLLRQAEVGQRDGITTKPVDTNSPSFTTPALTTTTRYWVRVSNSVGSVDSATATVTATPIPTEHFVLFMPLVGRWVWGRENSARINLTPSGLLRIPLERFPRS